MPIYYGLNINKAMSDIGNNRVALGNLGLRIENLDLIKGLSDVIDIEELHTLSGLVDDQKAMIKQLDDASEVTELLVLSIPKIDVDQKYNYRMSDRLLSGTIKYNYIDFNGEDELGNPDWVSKGADISTSRVSSWSPFGPEDNPDALITYNSDILIKGEFLGVTQIGLTSKPEAKRFESEVATNTIRLNINGAPVDVLAMQGIPFKLRMNIKQPNLTIKVTEPPLLLASGSRVPITIVREDISTGEEILGNNGNAIIEFTPDQEGFTNIRGNLTENTEDVQEDYKIYYNVSRLESISAFNSGIEEWPEITMKNLTDLSLSENSIEVMPNLDKYAPNIKNIDLSFNPLFNMDNYQNENNLNSDGTIFGGGIQNMLNRLPPSLLDLNLANSLGGNYSNQRLDLRKFRGIKRFKISSTNQYEDAQDIIGGVSPTYLVLGDEYPLVPDPATRIENLNPSNSNPDNGATFDLATGIITQPFHGFDDDDTILYDVHIGKTSGTFGDLELGEIGTAMGGLTPGNYYKIDYISVNQFKLKNLNDTTSNTLSITSVGSGNAHSITKWDTTKNSIYLDPTVGIERLETDNNGFKYLTTGVLDSPRLKVYEMLRANSLLGSERGKYYQQSPNATAAVAMIKRYEDLIIDLKTEILTNFTQDGGQINIPDFSKWADTLKTVTLKDMKIHYGINRRENDAPNAYPWSTIDWFKSPYSDLNADKFNLNVIQSISIENIYSGQGNYLISSSHVLGDMRGFMANKPLLTSVTYKDIIGPKFDLNDDAFSGSISLENVDLKLPGGSGYTYMWANNNDFEIVSGRQNRGQVAPGNSVDRQVAGKYRKFYILDDMHDFLGVSGPAGSNKTAKLFDPVLSSLKTFRLNGSGGDYDVKFNDSSFPANDQRKIDLSGFSVLNNFEIKGCELSGKIPSFENCGNLSFFTIEDTRARRHPLSMTPGNIYSMQTKAPSDGILYGTTGENEYFTYGQYGIGNDYTNTYSIGDYIDIGLDMTKTNSDFVPWGDSTSRQNLVPRGSTGLIHTLAKKIPHTDAFVYKYVDADDVVSGNWYTIVDLGNTTAQQWRDLGILPGVTPEVGMQFKARNWIDHFEDINYPENNGQNLGIKLNRFNIRDAYLAIGPGGSTLGPGDYLKVWRQGRNRGSGFSAYDVLFGYNGYPNNPSYQPPDGAGFRAGWPDDGFGVGEIVQIRLGPYNGTTSFSGLAVGQRAHYVERMPGDRNSFGTAKFVRHTYQRPCTNLGGSELETSNANNEIIGIGSLKELVIKNTNFYTNSFPVLKQEIIGDNASKNLITLNLDNNRLGGSLPDLRNVEALKTISLSRNEFTSYVPGHFSQLGGSLIKIDLSNNKLTAQDGVNLFNDLYDVYTSTGETLTGVSLILNGQDPNSTIVTGTGSVANAENRSTSSFSGNPLIIEGSSNARFTTEISPGQYIRIKYVSTNWANDFAAGAVTAWVKVASIQNDQRLTLAEVPPGYQIDNYRGFEIQTKVERLSEEALEDNDAALGSPDDSAFEKFKTLNTRWSILIDYDKLI